jgi:hypothetical protein
MNKSELINNIVFGIKTLFIWACMVMSAMVILYTGDLILIGRTDSLMLFYSYMFKYHFTEIILVPTALVALYLYSMLKDKFYE